MNVNEVISNIAALKTNSKLGSHQPIHPNDDVNKSQSTNDTFPAAIQISVVNEIIKNLVPTIREFTKVLDKKSEEWKDLIKIGRTHFQDAVPLTFGQLIPVPTAVPPRGKKYNSFRLIIIAFSASLSCSDHPDISCLLYTSPSPRDKRQSRMPSSA